VASTRGDFEALSSRRAERAGALIAAQAGHFDDAAGVIARVVAMRVAQERADHHVVKHRHVLERGRHLEGAPDAGARMRFGRGASDIRAVE